MSLFKKPLLVFAWLCIMAGPAYALPASDVAIVASPAGKISILTIKMCKNKPEIVAKTPVPTTPRNPTCQQPRPRQAPLNA